MDDDPLVPAKGVDGKIILLLHFGDLRDRCGVPCWPLWVMWWWHSQCCMECPTETVIILVLDIDFLATSAGRRIYELPSSGW